MRMEIRIGGLRKRKKNEMFESLTHRVISLRRCSSAFFSCLEDATSIIAISLLVSLMSSSSCATFAAAPKDVGPLLGRIFCAMTGKGPGERSDGIGGTFCAFAVSIACCITDTARLSRLSSAFSVTLGVVVGVSEGEGFSRWIRGDELEEEPVDVVSSPLCRIFFVLRTRFLSLSSIA